MYQQLKVINARIASSLFGQHLLQPLAANGEKIHTTSQNFWKPNLTSDDEKGLIRVRETVDYPEIHTLETSIEYMKSKAFSITYGDEPLWKHYRLNHPGPRAPILTRPNCIRYARYVSKNPCPICRDHFLVVDYKNPELLKHFILDRTRKMINPVKVGVCQYQAFLIIAAINKAYMHGILTFPVPYKDYSHYYSEYANKLEDK